MHLLARITKAAICVILILSSLPLLWLCILVALGGPDGRRDVSSLPVAFFLLVIAIALLEGSNWIIRCSRLFYLSIISTCLLIALGYCSFTGREYLILGVEVFIAWPILTQVVKCLIAAIRGDPQCSLTSRWSERP